MGEQGGGAAPPSGLELAAAVARRHLVAGESKVEIADDLGLSRFKVARLIDQAHAAGLVRIEVRDPAGAEADLETRLRERWGLRHVHVVPARLTASDVRRSVGEGAARLLCRVLSPGDVLGLPWSRGVHDMVNALQTLDLRPPAVPVVQLSGALAAGSEDSSTVDVVRRAARVLQGGRQVFFAPLVMPDGETAAVMRREPSVQDTLASADEVTVAVVGIGAWRAGESTVFDAVDAETRQQVSHAGAVGDAAGVPFDAAGAPVSTPLSDRLITLTPAQLLKIPDVLAIAHGPGKVAAVRAAVSGRLVTGLVTTEDTARMLLEV